MTDTAMSHRVTTSPSASLLLHAMLSRAGLLLVLVGLIGLIVPLGQDGLGGT
jgi:preprotein translocase subunit Sss1